MHGGCRVARKKWLVERLCSDAPVAMPQLSAGKIDRAFEVMLQWSLFFGLAGPVTALRRILTVFGASLQVQDKVQPPRFAMKPLTKNRFLLSLAIVGLVSPLAFGATYYWDTNGTTAGFGTASGTWTAPTVSRWSTSSAGTATPGASITTLSTDAANDAVNFGNGTTGLAAGTITVSGTVQSGNMTFASGSGAIVLSGGAINLTNAATGPTLTVNSTSAASTIASNVSGGLASATITKSGAGTLILSGTNTYAGTTSISAGMLRLDSAGALPGGLGATGGTGGLTFNGGVLGLGAGDFLRPYNATQGTAGAFSTPANFGAAWAAYGADRIVNVGGAGATQQWFNGKPVNLGASDATHKVTLVNGLTLTTVTRPLVVNRGLAPVDAQLNGVFTQSAGAVAGIDKTGTGILAVTGNSTFTGSFVIRSGSVIVNNIANSGTACPIGQGTSGFTLAGGTFQYAPINGVGAAGHTSDRTFGITASSSLDASGTGALVLNNTSVISPDVTGQTGTWAASGSANITGLTSTANLAIGMRVTSSSPGIPAGAVITQILSSTSVTLSANTTAAATGQPIAFGYPTARTLTLTGSNTNANTIAGILQDSSSISAGVLSLAKTGAGTWALFGLNTFTGNVTVSNGILAAAAVGNGAASALGSVSNSRTITVSTGGTLRFSAPNVFSTNFNAPASGLPVLNIAGGTLTNGDSATNSALGNITLTGGTLTATTGSPIGTGQSGEGWGSWNLNGTVTSTGASTISSTAPGGIPITLSTDSGNGFLTTFDVQGGTLTASAPFGNVTRVTNLTSTGMTKTGSGAMLLTAANTYTGATNVNAGTLTVTSTGSLANTAISTSGNGTFAATPGSGALNLGNSGTTAAGATLSLASGTTFSMIDGSAGGTVNLIQEASFAGTALTLNGSNLNFELGGAAADKLAVTGTASVSGTNSINIVLAGALTPGNYDLITAASGLNGGGSFVFSGSGTNTQAIASGTDLYFLTLNNSAGSQSVNVSTPTTFSALTWTGQANGNGIADSVWSNGANSNWAADTLACAFTNGTAVTFGDSNATTGSTVSNSTVTIAAGGVTPTSTTFDHSTVNYTLSGGSIGGSGGISKLGTGILTLNSANSFGGGLSVAAGSVVLGNASAASAGTISINTGAATNASVQFSGALTVTNPISIATGSLGTNAVGNVGTGVVTLNGPVSISSGTALTLDSSSSNNSALDVGTGLITGGGSLVATGTSTGNFIFRGASTYSGGTTLGGAGIFVPALSTTGPAGSPTDGVFGTGAITTGNISIRSTTTADTTIGNPLTLGGDLTAITSGSEKTLTFSGPVTLVGNRTLSSSVGVTVAGKSLTISGVIGEDVVGRTLTKSGSGNLVLSAANTYSGGTTLTAGTVFITNAASFGTGDVTVSGASRIITSQGAGVSMTFANNINVGAGLTLQNPQTATGATSTFSGALTGSSPITVEAGTGNGVLSGLAFTNTNNTFTGSVIMPSGTTASTPTATGNDIFSFASIGDGGTFTFQKRGHTNAIAYTGSSDITFNTRQIALGAEFGNGLYDGGGVNPINRFMNNGTGTVTFNTNLTPGAVSTVTASATFFFDGTNSGSNTFAGIISNPTNATILGIGKNGSGKWILTGANSYTGNATIADGTLSVTTIDLAANNQPLGRSTLIQLGNSSTSGTLEYTGASNAATDKQVVLGNLTNNNQTGAGGIANNSPTGTLTFSSSTFNSITGATVTTVTRTLTLGGSNTGANTISGIIQNNAAGAAVALNKVGAGSWVLAGGNTYSGTTTLNQGTLTVSPGGTLGAATGALSVNNTNISGAGTDAVLNLSTSSDTTKGSLSGTIAVPTSGTNTVTINNGGNGRNFTINQTTTGIFPGVIAGDGGFTLGSLSTASLTLSGANTYSGSTTVNAGTLILGNSTALGSGAATVNGGSLNLNGQTTTNNVSVASGGTLTGSGSIGSATLAGTVTPGGTSPGLITMATATVSSPSTIALQLPAAGTRGTNYDAITVSNALALDGTITVNITGLTPAIGQSFDLIDSTGSIDVTNFNVATDLVLPALPAGLVWNTSTFATDGVVSIVSADPFIPWAASKGLTTGNNGKADDPDGDGRNNLYEFAFDGNPLSGGNDGKVVGKLAVVGGNQVLTLTLPVRTGASFTAAGGDQLSALIDGITYRVEGDGSLGPFADSITEVPSGLDLDSIQAGLPGLSSGWSYRTFRAPGTIPIVPKAFLRAKISE